MNFDAFAGGGLKWWYNFSEISGLGSVVTKHDTTYCATALNKAKASTGDSGDFQDAAGGGATSTSPNFVDGQLKTGISNLDFIGDENHLDISDAGGIDMAAFTIYMVIEVINEDANIVNIFCGNQALEDYIYYNANVNRWTYKINNGTQVLTDALAITDGTNYIMSVGFQNGTAIKVRLANAGGNVGSQVTSTSDVSADFNMKALGSIVGEGSYTADLHVGEVLIYDSYHTDSQAKEIVKELKKEWGLAY